MLEDRKEEYKAIAESLDDNRLLDLYRDYSVYANTMEFDNAREILKALRNEIMRRLEK